MLIAIQFLNFVDVNDGNTDFRESKLYGYGLLSSATYEVH